MSGGKTVAYLIDPYTGTITPQMITDSLKDIYHLIGCNLIEAVRLEEMDDVIFVDEEGLFKTNDETRYFTINTGVDYKLICGRGLWVGTDDEGDTCSPSKFITDLVPFVRCVVNNERAGALAQRMLDGSGTVIFNRETADRAMQQFRAISSEIAALEICDFETGAI